MGMSWRPIVPVALLVAVAAVQVTLVYTADLSPWKGGGFGMFSTTDDSGRRHVRIFVSAKDRSEEITIAPSLEDVADRAAVLPTDYQLTRLAQRVVAREARYQRPVDVVRIDTWRIVYAPLTLTATSQLIRSFEYRVDELLRRGRSEDGIADPILQLTGVMLLLRPFDESWLVGPIALAAACLAVVVPSVRRAPVTWLILAVLSAARVALAWPLADNHHYLLAYWCLAIALALSGPAPAAILASSARWLLAAAFTLAVVWKGVLSPDYLDGSFFRVTLLTDGRFADASMIFGGLSPDQMTQNRAFLDPLPEGAELLEPPPFVEPPRLRTFAALATWGGLVLEGLIAVLLVLPSGTVIAAARHLGLLTFCVTTYALAPVAGFGWLIATLGLAPVCSGSASAAGCVRGGVRPDPDLLRAAVDDGAAGLDHRLGGAIQPPTLSVWTKRPLSGCTGRTL